MAAQTQTVAPADAMSWLKKIAAASHQTNYTGTFVYQHDNRVETSSIAHFVDGRGEYEKLEIMDGPPREIIRDNDNVTCYLPEAKTVVVEKRAPSRFPSILPEQLSVITENYTIKKGETDRVAGHDCQTITLEPRDNLRYGHKFCVELNSGLPLRARMYNDSNQIVEAFAFTQFNTGGAFNKDALKSRYAAKSKDWHVDRSALEHGESSAESGWTLTNQPAGFKKLTEMKRLIDSGAVQVSQLVYSDGLAAVSVFIEPLPKVMPPTGPTYQGAVNIFVRADSEHIITVMGETPARTVKQIAEALSYSKH